MTTPAIPDERRRAHEACLLALTQIPTATGREDRVIAWIDEWASARDDITIDRDPCGNLVLTSAHILSTASDAPPVWITAHLDHPAFVVVGFEGQTVILEFRGGVMADYFKDARVRVICDDDSTISATLTGEIVHVVEGHGAPDAKPMFKRYRATLDAADAVERVALGDPAVWELPEAEILEEPLPSRDDATATLTGRVLHTNACDDLAAAAAALSAFDELRRIATDPGDDRRAELSDVRLLFTLAEEVGFVGAIGACKHNTIPAGARVIALENSRSFPHDSPLGGGPIVRVGDRVSVFSPSLTGAVAKVAETIAGGASMPTAQQKQGDLPQWRWQRKLMAGGACEASVFCAYGHESTCVCLPLGNYHNMGDLSAVQAGTNTEPARVGREYIALDDYHGMIDLLVGCGHLLGTVPPFTERVEKLWTERAHLLGVAP